MSFIGRFSKYDRLSRRYRTPVLRRESLASVTTEITPVSTAELKTYLEYDASDKDTLIESLLATAVDQFEAETSHYISEQQREAEFWPPGGVYKIPAQPFVSLDKVEQTEEGTRSDLDASDYFTKEGPPLRIIPKDFIANLSGELDGIIFTYTVGYTDAADVPDGIKTILKKMVVDLFEYRSSKADVALQIKKVPMDWKTLTAPYRVPYIP